MKPCPRCGSPMTGKGKTGLCQSCATSLGNRQRYPKLMKKLVRRAVISRQKTQRAQNQMDRRPEGYAEPSLPKLKFLEDAE